MTAQANAKPTSLFEKLMSRPRYQRWSVYLVLAYGVYCLILGILIPSVLTQVLPDKFQQFTGRVATIEKISINPFLLRLTATGLNIQETPQETIRHPDADKNFSGFSAFVIEFRFWHSLLNQAISIEKIELLKPYGFITLKRGPKDDSQLHPFTFTQLSYNFSDILRKLAQPESEKQNQQTNANESTPQLMIGSFKLTEGDFRLYDILTQTHINYPRIDLRLADFDTKKRIATSDDKVKPNRFSFHATGIDDNEIHTQGQAQLSPFQLNAVLQVSRLQFSTFWPLIKQHIQAQLTGGHLNLSSKFTVEQTAQGTDFSIENELITIEELKLDYDNNPFISLPLFAVEGMLVDSKARTVNINKLHTQDLVTELVVDEHGVNLANLLTPDLLLENTPENAESASLQNAQEQNQQGVSEENKLESEQAWLITVDGSHIENYQLTVSEKLATGKFNDWEFSGINLQLGRFISDLSNTLNYDLQLAINDSAALATRGKLDLKQQAVNANFTLDNFPLNSLQGYIAPHINIVLENGSLSTQGTVLANSTQDIKLTSGLVIDELAVKDKLLTEPLLSWKKLKINKIDYQSQDNQLTLDTIGISKAFAKIIVTEDRKTNISELMVVQADKSSAITTQPKKIDVAKQPDVASKPLQLVIGKVLLDEGSAFFADKSLTPNFSASIEQLQGGISQLSSTGNSKANVDIKGKIDRYAPVTLKGQVNPLLAQPYLDLALDFNHVELTSVNPYSGTYAGYYIDKGQLSLALNYLLEDNQLKGNNHLVIDQLELGKPSNSDLATSLPITLAIALLQDTNGVIDLGMEVSGDVNSPDFSVGSIVMTALTNVITKAVTSPFSLLASLIGSDEELDKLVYSPGSSDLADPQQQKLTQLAQALAKRPKLSLSVEGALDIPKDTQALKALQLATQLHQFAPDVAIEKIQQMGASSVAADPLLGDAIIQHYKTKLEQDPNTILSNINDKHQAKNADAPSITPQALDIEWKIALYNLSLNAQTIEKDTLGQLAQQRAQTVKAFMVDKLATPAESVFILDSRIKTKEAGSLALLSLEAN